MDERAGGPGPEALQNYSAMRATDPHQPVRDDVRLLGELLGETLRRQEGQALFDRVESVRALSKQRRRESGDVPGHGFDALTRELTDIPVTAAVPIARAFAQFLNLANV